MSVFEPLFPYKKIVIGVTLSAAVAFYLFSFWQVANRHQGFTNRNSPDCYYQLAQSLTEGAGLSLGSHFTECDQANSIITVGPTAMRPPVYPLMLASLIKISNDNPALPRIVQAVIGICLILACYWLGAKAASPFAGLIAAVFISIGGGLPTYAYLLMADIVSLALVTLLFALLLYKRSGWYCVVEGALLGIVFLTRNTASLTAPLLIIWILFFFPRPFRSVSLFIIGTGVVLTPWIIRNAILFGSFIPFSTISGDAALTAYNPVTFETPGAIADTTALPGWEDLIPLTEPERDAQRWAWVFDEFRRQPPEKILNLFKAKIVSFIFFSNSIEINQPASTALSVSFFGALAALTVVFIFQRRLPARLAQWLEQPHNRQMAWLIFAIFLGQLVIVLMVRGDGRQRFAIEPFMALSLGIIGSWLWPHSGPVKVASSIEGTAG